MADSTATELRRYDLVVSGGRVFDGRNWLSAPQHIGIVGNRIAAISPTPLSGAREIDAAGSYVLPGLIDTHIHLFDFTVATEMPTR